MARFQSVVALRFQRCDARVQLVDHGVRVVQKLVPLVGDGVAVRAGALLDFRQPLLEGGDAIPVDLLHLGQGRLLGLLVGFEGVGRLP